VSEEIEYQVRQDDIAPFWQKMAFFFLFPFRTGPIVTLACITAVSALAGLIMGPIGLAFKGLLVYAGLRYAFKVLDLFSSGKFEGESPEFSFGGSERRPAKFGLVVALFLVAGSTLGAVSVTSRLATDRHLQERFVEQYKADRAAVSAREEQEDAAQRKRLGLDTATPDSSTQDSSGAQNEDDPQASTDDTPLPIEQAGHCTLRPASRPGRLVQAPAGLVLAGDDSGESDAAGCADRDCDGEQILQGPQSRACHLSVQIHGWRIFCAVDFFPGAGGLTPYRSLRRRWSAGVYPLPPRNSAFNLPRHRTLRHGRLHPVSIPSGTWA
jgi:hypothetical protein